MKKSEKSSSYTQENMVIDATIESVTILSSNEFEKHKSIIEPLSSRWWLRSKGSVPYCTQAVYRDRNGDNVIDVQGDHVIAERLVRPAICIRLPITDIRVFYRPEMLIGRKVSFSDYEWTILEANLDEWYILCDTAIVSRRFDINDVAWKDSELKKWLEFEWLPTITK